MAALIIIIVFSVFCSNLLDLSLFSNLFQRFHDYNLLNLSFVFLICQLLIHIILFYF